MRSSPGGVWQAEAVVPLAASAHLMALGSPPCRRIPSSLPPSYCCARLRHNCAAVA
ncbi:hypothetical protein PF005_g3793 [Phytophthora fragariae]|uniref:Uncharacterized protein n=1 Tax=Phytophthora fragariae TaxID=53985 RepID=A0A6A3FQY3_9STRA|nr:hypothetical protein PF009_g3950 [Phytophthora fragariae]KAE9025416.1 hypothetical protein PF011_g3038 [Phytophthora fragariae]KAE9131825.1 hypothetical protein PF010_g3392 [Phytophthora fragariae]KAE9132466.1 hypothetical protein PF007_g3704 [Phytophthora fragariae]KAE9152538.1 hypothetical protein PF006_g3241 [Phytophthora fragariae]